MTERYCNKKLRAAIEEGKSLRWEFGSYRKYYKGLKLLACSGYAETGRVYESGVFCTNSEKGAREILDILAELGIVAQGFDSALKGFTDYRESFKWRI